MSTGQNLKTYDANTLPLTSVTQGVVTTPDLVLNVYDPNAKYIPEYRKTPRSRHRHTRRFPVESEIDCRRCGG